MNEVYLMLKSLKKDYVVMVKAGNFYYTYNDDSSIISYLLGYKINEEERVGFPVNSLIKVTNKLIKHNINYYIDEGNSKEFDNNNYYQILEKGKLYNSLSKDIEEINNYLINNIERKYIKRIISKIKEVIDEG